MTGNRSSSLSELKERIEIANKQLEDPSWSNIDIFKLMLAAKRESQNKSGKALDCFALTYPEQKHSEGFVEFFDKLKSKLSSFSEECRFQLVVYSDKNHHWTPFDIVIKNGNLNVVCIDPANNNSAMILLKLILEKFPNCKSYYLQPDVIKVDDKDRPRLIHYSQSGCSRMALETAFRLSKSNLVYKLDSMELQTEYDIKRENKEKASGNKNIKYFKPDHVIAESPDLYRICESWTALESFGNKNLNAIVSSKGLTLREYAELHSDTTEIVSQGKTITKKANLTLSYKTERFIEKIRAFIKNHSAEELGDVLLKCEASDFLAMSSTERLISSRQQQATYPINEILLHLLDKMIKNNEILMQQVNERYKVYSGGHPNRLDEAHERSLIFFIKKGEELQKLKGIIDSMLSGVSKDDQVKILPRILSLPMPETAKKVFLKACTPYLPAISRLSKDDDALGGVKNDESSAGQVTRYRKPK